MKNEAYIDVKSRRGFLRVLGLYVPGLALAMPALAAPLSSSLAGLKGDSPSHHEIVSEFFVSMIGSLRDSPITAIVKTDSPSEDLKLPDGRVFKVKIMPYKILGGYGRTYTAQVLNQHGRVLNQTHIGPRTTVTFHDQHVQITTQPVSSVSKLIDEISSNA